MKDFGEQDISDFKMFDVQAALDFAVSIGDTTRAIELLNEGLLRQDQIVAEGKAKISLYAEAWAYASTTASGYWTQVGEVAFDSLKRMEDYLTNFVMTGKMKFRDFANSVIADLVRIAIRANITAPLAGVIGSIWPAFGGGRAYGGSVYPGFVYDVGERGPERFIPSVPGKIVPGASAAGMNIKVEVINQTSQNVRAESKPMRFDGERYILGVVLKGIENNTMGMRYALGGG